MATISELQMLMNYDETQRRRLETQERQAARDSFSMFTGVAGKKISTADEIVSQAEGESNEDALDKLSEQLESTKTGVGYVDNLIDAKGQEISLRKRTVNAKNKIVDHINDINTQLGDDKTVGAKKLIDELDIQYNNVVDQLEQGEKTLIFNQVKNAKNNFQFRLLKNQYDTDPEKEGYQLPAYMEDADKQYFDEVIRPRIEVGEQSGSYVEAISAMQSGFKQIRDERTQYDAASDRSRVREVKEVEKKVVETAEQNRMMQFNQLQTFSKNYLEDFGELPGEDLPGSNKFYDKLSSVSEFTSSMTGKNLETTDLRGMLKNVDELIMLNSDENYKGINDSAYITGYIDKGDPLDQNHMKNMAELIEMNTYRRKGKEDEYNIRYGSGSTAFRGMFNLINQRDQIIKMLNTPGLTLQSIDPNQKRQTTTGFGQSIQPKQ